jgi:cytochrome c-type biogenesis protein CcsB
VNESLAHLSNNFVYSAMVVLTIAMICFAVDFAYGPGAARAGALRRRPSAERTPVNVGAGGASTTVAVTAVDDVDDVGGDAGSDQPPAASRWGRIGVSLSTLALGLLVAAVVARGMAAGRLPWGNMYEFSVMAATAVLGVWLFLIARGRQLQFLGLFISFVVLMTLGVAVTLLYTEAAQLVPALKSYWLGIHVTAAIIASGVFTVGAALTVLYLAVDHVERRVAAGKEPGRWQFLARRMPDAATLDRNAYKTFAFAFPLWTFAVIAGAIWAENAWGRYWGWDPKETWAFITWVFFAAYLHARATAGWKGRPASYIALLGYSAFLFNYFAVNIWFFGLHSYSGV